jgi:hypothetical protein
MATVRDIITHVEVQVAVNKRICHHNRRKHSVPSGHKCLAVHDHDGGRKNYCLECAIEILAKAKSRLLQMESDIHN